MLSAACKDEPSCAEVGEKLWKQASRKAVPKADARFIGEFCTDQKWSVEARSCLAANPQLEACKAQLKLSADDFSIVQHNLAPPAPTID